jgi:hypothetical protein
MVIAIEKHAFERNGDSDRGLRIAHPQYSRASVKDSLRILSDLGASGASAASVESGGPPSSFHRQGTNLDPSRQLPVVLSGDAGVQAAS